MEHKKRVAIYTKNGNCVEVLSSTVSQYLKKGFTKTDPKKILETKESEKQ